jgi:hypothetical protein
MTDDRHSPTTAGPTPTPTPTPAPVPSPDPTPGITAVASSPPRPAAAAAAEPPSELPFGIPPDRPEILVGAAFAGGLVAAFILRRLGGD